MIRLNSRQARCLLDAIPVDTQDDVRAIVEQVTDQLNNPTHFTDVIDTFARILGDPKAKMTLTAGLLGAMRDAVLVPRELMRVRGLENHGFVCGACRKEFAGGEIGSVNGANVYCTACQVPTFVRCHSCNMPKEIPISARKTIVKSAKTCTCMKPAAVGAAVEEAEQFNTEAPRTAGYIPTPNAPNDVAARADHIQFINTVEGNPNVPATLENITDGNRRRWVERAADLITQTQQRDLADQRRLINAELERMPPRISYIPNPLPTIAPPTNEPVHPEYEHFDDLLDDDLDGDE